MLSLRLALILLVATIRIVAAVDGKPEFAPPGILASMGDLNTTLRPHVGNPVEAYNGVGTKLIRGLLMTRQSGCQAGYGLCADGISCCPIGGQCCGGNAIIVDCCGVGRWCYSTGCCSRTENGCEGVSCCSFGTSCCRGGGCCEPGYYCVIVDGTKGCCRNGQICGSGGGGECVDPEYVRCPGEDFCCPPRYTCYRDSANNPRCSLYSTYTITSTSTISTPTLTSTSPRPTSTTNGNNGNSDNSPPNNSDNSPPNNSDNSPPNNSDSNSNGSNLTSSSSSSSPSPSPSGPLAQSSSAADWKVFSSFFGLVPFLVLIVYVL
ncbi:hypothetical protein BDM02DRAFT_1366281 [Thelephora ganbajun]|uniref:Uncharacterized protein n=1 Tax=Thelephora ganbajun TaxID=370292 RepID=A0ACB6Z1T9_THEGA|nr:hypothetical protein BDM02DRAFT_1366281 [Thelephora ganbajun]